MDKLVEQLVTFPLTDEYTFAGKIDEVQPHNRRIVDYKGVSSISDFMDQRAISFQVEDYVIAVKRALDLDIQEIEYRLIERPSIKFCGKDKGNLDYYELRCLEWLRQRGRLKTTLVPINEYSLKSAMRFLQHTVVRIEQNKRDKTWHPNHNACQDWGHTCEFLPLCEAQKYGQDAKALVAKDYHHREVRHPELGINDKGTITYSSSSELAQCEAKYFWHYHMQLSRTGQMATPPLFIGAALHEGMKALAEGGVEAARAAVTEWGSKQRVLGQDMVLKRDEMLAKAKAMFRAAAEKWQDLEPVQIDMKQPDGLALPEEPIPPMSRKMQAIKDGKKYKIVKKRKSAERRAKKSVKAAKKGDEV